MEKLYNIPSFLKYLNLNHPKSDFVHAVQFDKEGGILLQSKPVTIDFYILAIKTNVDIPQSEGMATSYVYLDGPDKTLEWNFSQTFSGYGLFINAKLLDKHAKEYNFMNYNSHEALFVTEEEKTILLDLFEKAYNEYQKPNFSKEVIVSYTALLLSYTHQFYERQFETRSKIYNKVVANFYEHLDEYFKKENQEFVLPSVSFFADKANLTANYFGDLIKHFTGNNPNYHIHQYVIQVAKAKLRESDMTVSEIAFSLGFEYPTYFTRFFKKEVGITPTEFRNQ